MTKKKPLTPEQLKECAAAHDIFLKKKNELKLSQKKIADAANMSASAVNLYFKGVNSLNLPFAIVLSKVLSVPISEFSPRLAAEAEEISKTTARAAPQAQDTAEAAEPSPATILARLKGKATPQTQQTLERLCLVDEKHGLSNHDIAILEAIISRYETNISK